jgi:hypothetical protein
MLEVNSACVLSSSARLLHTTFILHKTTNTYIHSHIEEGKNIGKMDSHTQQHNQLGGFPPYFCAWATKNPCLILDSNQDPIGNKRKASPPVVADLENEI